MTVLVPTGCEPSQSNPKVNTPKIVVIEEIPKKVWLTLAFSLAAFVFVEVALQVRSQMRYGTSIFTSSASESTYVFDEALGIQTLRPNAVIDGSQSTIRTNSIGLRSPEISIAKAPGERRIAVLGASTVMGTYTRDNEDTLSYQLERLLQPYARSGPISVVNAGIAGAGIAQQTKLLERLLIPVLKPDLLIWYSGFNDISGYCRKSEGSHQARTQPAIFTSITLPKWLLSVELLTKNTVWLRTAKAGDTDAILASAIEIAPFEKKVQSLLATAEKHGIPTLVVTNARSFRRDMPIETQQRLSETARYYNHCFDLNGLHDTYDLHNAAIVRIASQVRFPTLRLDERLEGGPTNFGDATHFSIKGTEEAAKLISRAIVDDGLIQP